MGYAAELDEPVAMPALQALAGFAIDREAEEADGDIEGRADGDGVTAALDDVLVGADVAIEGVTDPVLKDLRRLGRGRLRFDVGER